MIIRLNTACDQVEFGLDWGRAKKVDTGTPLGRAGWRRLFRLKPGSRPVSPTIPRPGFSYFIPLNQAQGWRTPLLRVQNSPSVKNSALFAVRSWKSPNKREWCRFGMSSTDIPVPPSLQPPGLFSRFAHMVSPLKSSNTAWVSVIKHRYGTKYLQRVRTISPLHRVGPTKQPPNTGNFLHKTDESLVYATDAASLRMQPRSNQFGIYLSHKHFQMIYWTLLYYIHL